MMSGLPPGSPKMESSAQYPPAPSQRETTSIEVPTILFINIQDHILPKSVVVRVAKSVLPENTMIQKEAVIALVKSATVFINYLASTYILLTYSINNCRANDVTRDKGKKTINNEEVLEALKMIEFDSIIPVLREQIERIIFLLLCQN